MKEIGKLLKEKREQMGISLADVHKAIKVHEKYLIAIEEGDMSVFFAEVYYKSFVRSYAKYLGFNSEKLIEIFNTKNLSSNIKKESYLFEDSTNIIPRFFKKFSYKNLTYINKLLIIFVVGVILVIFLCLNKHISLYNKIEIPHRDEILSHENKHEKYIVIEEKFEVPTNSRQKLIIKAVSNVWIKVNSDDILVYEGTLEKGKEKSWEADKSFMFKIDYVPGVKVFFNGKEIDINPEDINIVIFKRYQKNKE